MIKIVSKRIGSNYNPKEHKLSDWSHALSWCEETVDIHFDMDGRSFTIKLDWSDFLEFFEQTKIVSESDLALQYIAKTLVGNWDNK